MAFPRPIAGKFGAEDVAVPKRRQRRKGAACLPLRFGHLRPAPAQHPQLPEFRLHIDYRDHIVLHPLRGDKIAIRSDFRDRQIWREAIPLRIRYLGTDWRPWIGMMRESSSR